MPGIRRRCLLSLAVLLSLATGCASPPTYTPEVAGVVTVLEQLPDDSYRLTLAEGRSVTVDTRRQRGILGSVVPQVGDLLLAGASPEPWVARLVARDACFWVGGSGTEEDGYITMDRGLRLPEAATFDRAHYRADEHEFHSGGFCVNESGEVTAVK